MSSVFIVKRKLLRESQDFTCPLTTAQKLSGRSSFPRQKSSMDFHSILARKTFQEIFSKSAQKISLMILTQSKKERKSLLKKRVPRRIRELRKERDLLHSRRSTTGCLETGSSRTTTLIVRSRSPSIHTSLFTTPTTIKLILVKINVTFKFIILQ